MKYCVVATGYVVVAYALRMSRNIDKYSFGSSSSAIDLRKATCAGTLLCEAGAGTESFIICYMLGMLFYRWCR